MLSTGIVIIGRNEGEKLRRCLLSVAGRLRFVVYVDSGSTDSSVALAQEVGVVVVVLGSERPFTAARGRNAGFARLMEFAPDLEYVQFIDGDCELIQGWLETAVEFMQLHAEHAVVCGRLRERHPEASIYNRLCDLEWNGPIGNIEACGGIFMVRAKVFAEVGGMNSTIVAGEEPEMCLRVRRKGCHIARLPCEMAWHDANMTRFSQWWKRTVRSGYAYGQGYALHGKDKEKYCLRASLRIWFWALVLPLISLLFMIILEPLFGILLILYLLQFFKIIVEKNREIQNFPHSLLYSIFNILGKFPQLIGQVQFLILFFQNNILIIDRINIKNEQK